MRCIPLLSILAIATISSFNSSPADEKSNKGHGIAADKKIEFPYRLPNNNTEMDHELVDHLNTLSSKKEQVKDLLELLPDPNLKNRMLTDKQLQAIQLLGLTATTDVVQPLIERLDFVHQKHGASAAHSLARLGEISVEPLIADIQKTNNHQRLNLGVMALKELKGKDFAGFVDVLKQRKDVKLSDKALRMLELFVVLQIR